MRSNRTPITEEITAEKIYKKKYEKNLKQILEIKEYFYKKQISTEKKEQYLYKNIIEKLDEII